MPRKPTGRKPGRPSLITDAAVELAVDLLARRIHKSVIKRALAVRPHWITEARTAERVLSRARASILARTGQPKDEHQADAVAYYEAVLRDPKATVRDKLTAQEGLRKLLGLDKPYQVELGGTGGGAIKCIVGINLDDV